MIESLLAPVGEPSPDEIAAACREIRRGWSEREHYRRAGLPVPRSLTHEGDELAIHSTPPLIRRADSGLTDA